MLMPIFTAAAFCAAAFNFAVDFSSSGLDEACVLAWA
jgi:hypothetical protein